MSFYSGAKRLLSPFFRHFYRIKITGAENLPNEGGYVVCANHTSMFDVVALAASFDRLLRFMAKKELFKFKPFGALIRKVGAFPVDRGGADVKAIKTAISLVEAGELVNIFPQGTRRKKVDPSTTNVKSGAGMIAYHAKCGAIPVFIKTKNNHLHAFGKTELIIGKPIEYEDFGFENGGKREYDFATERIFSASCALGGYDYEIKSQKSENAGDGKAPSEET
ncbi:MAG: 1-acyl-sn-glycerol-3-phosphate acyltransferase [Clostridia bacterium]|nr:1-acyl-sn-glycerol-3-phosphate acyltransferase [Clostridia bacterium]